MFGATGFWRLKQDKRVETKEVIHAYSVCPSKSPTLNRFKTQISIPCKDKRIVGNQEFDTYCNQIRVYLYYHVSCKSLYNSLVQVAHNCHLPVFGMYLCEYKLLFIKSCHWARCKWTVWCYLSDSSRQVKILFLCMVPIVGQSREKMHCPFQACQ